MRGRALRVPELCGSCLTPHGMKGLIEPIYLGGRPPLCAARAGVLGGVSDGEGLVYGVYVVGSRRPPYRGGRPHTAPRRGGVVVFT